MDRMLKDRLANPGRRAALLGGLGLLAGCAAKPVLLDRSAMAGVKRVGLPTIGAPGSPTVQVAQPIGNSFGAIGILSTAIVRGNRESALKALLASQALDAQSCLTQAVTDDLRAQGLTVVPMAADSRRSSFVARADGEPTVQAILDIYISQYGFIAASDSDDAPYHPSVILAARLIGAQDRTVMMQDTVALNEIDVPLPQPNGAPPAPYAFYTFSQVTDDPVRAAMALRGALKYAADSVGKRLA